MKTHDVKPGDVFYNEPVLNDFGHYEKCRFVMCIGISSGLIASPAARRVYWFDTVRFKFFDVLYAETDDVYLDGVILKHINELEPVAGVGL